MKTLHEAAQAVVTNYGTTKIDMGLELIEVVKDDWDALRAALSSSAPSPSTADDAEWREESLRQWLAGAFCAYRVHGLDLDAAHAKAAWLRKQVESGRQDPVHLWELDAPAPSPSRDAAPPARDERAEALRTVLAIALKFKCVDKLCCADAKCRDAGHHDEHEVTSDGEGWCCGHDECHCAPACSGFAPHVCPDLRVMQEIVATVDAALSIPPSPPSQTPADADKE